MPWAVVDAFDDKMDTAVSRWRGRPVVDAIAFGASALGDHGLIWFLIGVVRGRKPGRRRRAAVAAVLFSGAVTPVVNTAVKSGVGRRRPDPREDDPRSVRMPRSASFPSGHSLAAWCAATMLADGDPLGPLYYLTAGAVSLSRIHLRQHHTTDVIAGAALGMALGRLGRCMAGPWTAAGTPPGMRGRRAGLSLL